MKTKISVMPIVVLTVICLVISTALAATYKVTKPLIIAAEAKAADEARMALLPDADTFTKLDIEPSDGFTEAYVADNGVGYVITTYASGYGGASSPMTVMTGIAPDGTIVGVKMTSNNETAGIGDQVGKDKFTSQYIGKDVNLEGVNTITGATISSSAFRRAVDTAFVVYGQIVASTPDAAAANS